VVLERAGEVGSGEGVGFDVVWSEILERAGKHFHDWTFFEFQ